MTHALHKSPVHIMLQHLGGGEGGGESHQVLDLKVNTYCTYIFFFSLPLTTATDILTDTHVSPQITVGQLWQDSYMYSAQHTHNKARNQSRKNRLRLKFRRG
jgi:hypothetical protein